VQSALAIAYGLTATWKIRKVFQECLQLARHPGITASRRIHHAGSIGNIHYGRLRELRSLSPELIDLGTQTGRKVSPRPDRASWLASIHLEWNDLETAE
jgi:hypothetical protein